MTMKMGHSTTCCGIQLKPCKEENLQPSNAYIAGEKAVIKLSILRNQKCCRKLSPKEVEKGNNEDKNIKK